MLPCRMLIHGCCLSECSAIADVLFLFGMLSLPFRVAWPSQILPSGMLGFSARSFLIARPLLTLVFKMLSLHGRWLFRLLATSLMLSSRILGLCKCCHAECSAFVDVAGRSEFMGFADIAIQISQCCRPGCAASVGIAIMILNAQPSQVLPFRMLRLAARSNHMDIAVQNARPSWTLPFRTFGLLRMSWFRILSLGERCLGLCGDCHSECLACTSERIQTARRSLQFPASVNVGFRTASACADMAIQNLWPFACVTVNNDQPLRNWLFMLLSLHGCGGSAWSAVEDVAVQGTWPSQTFLFRILSLCGHYHSETSAFTDIVVEHAQPVPTLLVSILGLHGHCR